MAFQQAQWTAPAPARNAWGGAIQPVATSNRLTPLISGSRTTTQSPPRPLAGSRVRS